MIDSVEPLTAKAKLALSRAELLAAMGYEEVKNEANGVLAVAEVPEPQRRPTVATISAKISRSVVGRWWRRHPLSSVMQVGQPFLETYARRHPGKLVAIGASAGAVFWILKPWKLLSAATMVTLIFKSSDISGMISDIVRKQRPAGQENLARWPGSKSR